MNVETVAIATTHPPARNVRRHPEVQLKELERAVVKFGQTRPIVLDETNTVLVGNGLVETFKRLGRETIEAIRVPGLSAADKQKLMLADNKIYDLGLDDYEAILATLKSFDDLDVPGFDPEVLRKLTASSADVEASAVHGYGTMAPAVQAQTAAKVVPAGSTAPGVSAPAAAGVTCPKCGYVIPQDGGPHGPTAPDSAHG